MLAIIIECTTGVILSRTDDFFNLLFLDGLRDEWGRGVLGLEITRYQSLLPSGHVEAE